MTELVLRNKEIIKKLDYVKDTVYSSKAMDSEYVKSKLIYHKGFDEDKLQEYLGEDYLYKHMNDSNHKGFPVEHRSFPVEHGMKDCSKLKEIKEYSQHDFVNELGATSDAVFLFYPPGGFVGWHNNANNSGHQFIFTHSTTGNGYFQYYDQTKKDIIVTKDQPGWRVHHHHFGKEDKDHCWHSAYAGENRITMCVLFRWWDRLEKKDQILEMKDLLIEEIESED